MPEEAKLYRVRIVSTGRYLHTLITSTGFNVMALAAVTGAAELGRGHALALAATWWSVTGECGVEIEEV